MMETQLNQILSDNLVRIRINRRFSQREVAAAIGISQTTYHRMEAGKVWIGAARLLAVARWYRIDMNLFFQEHIIFSSGDIPQMPTHNPPAQWVV